MKSLKILYVLLSVVTANIVANSAFEETKQAYITFAQNCDQSNARVMLLEAINIKNDNSRKLTLEEDLKIHKSSLDELIKKDECLGAYYHAWQQLVEKKASLCRYAKKRDTLRRARVLNLKHNPNYADYRRIHCKECAENDYEKIQDELDRLLKDGDLSGYAKLAREIGII